MYDKRLLTFIKAAELHSISKAAQQLFISSNAANKQIQSLEEEWNVQLFNRTSRGVSLTIQGKYLYDSSKNIINLSEEIMRNVSKKERKLPLFLSVYISGHPDNIFELCNKYSTSQKSTRIQYIPYCDYTDFIPDLISQMKYCDCFIGPKINQNPYNFTTLFKSPFSCAVPRNHPFSNRTHLKIEDLRNESITIIHDVVYPNLQALKKELNNPVVSVNSDETALKHKNQIWIIADHFNRFIMQRNYIPLISNSQLEIGVYWHKDADEDVIKFINYLKENAKQY